MTQSSSSTTFLSFFVPSQRLMASLVLLIALLQGLLHFFLLPPWQHYDEPTHFEYAWLIANRGELPEMGDYDLNMQREVAASMVEHDFYWNMSLPNLLVDEGKISLGFTELGHPPVYYTLVSLPLRLLRHLDMTSQLYVARSVSLLLFLLTVGVTIGLMRDLTPPGHLLRWAVPLTVALLPPFASHSTAVNNDVGAVFMLSLFLWGAVRLIRHGISLPRLLWLLITAGLAVMTKNTAGLALLMLPVALVIALWVRLGWRWRWRWLWLGASLIGLLGLLALVDLGDAAYWYRQEQRTNQLSPTRATSPGQPESVAVRVEVTNADPRRRLMNPLLPQDVQQIKGMHATVGGWVWADKSGQVLSPGLVLSEEGSNKLIDVNEPMTVTTSPTFYSHTYWIPPTTKVVYYSFWAKSIEPDEEPFDLYLSDAFLIAGELSPDMARTLTSSLSTSFESHQAADKLAACATSCLGLPAEIEQKNLVRNPSGAQQWLRLRPWVHETFESYIRRSPTYVFDAMQDVQKNGPFLLGLIAPWLVNDFFSAFAWGHVRLQGAVWLLLFRGLTALTLLGCLKWWLVQRGGARGREGEGARGREGEGARGREGEGGYGARGRAQGSPLPAILFLALVAGVVWVSAILWPLPYTWAKVQFPSGRYLYVAIIPMALLLAGGWWALWPRRYRGVGLLLWIVFLLFLNWSSVSLIRTFYASLPT